MRARHLHAFCGSFVLVRLQSDYAHRGCISALIYFSIMTEPEAIRIDHVQINVTDLPRARRFYGDLLGLIETPRPESFDFAGCWYRIGDVDLHLVVRPAEQPSARHFCLWVTDVHAAAEKYAAAGHPVAWDRKYKIR